MEIVKGLPTAAIPSGKIVELWVASPTGDSSDSLIFPIECRREDHAEIIADQWNTLMAGGMIRETIAACLSGHEVTAEQREEITEKIESILFPYVVEVVGEVIEETLTPAEESGE